MVRMGCDGDRFAKYSRCRWRGEGACSGGIVNGAGGAALTNQGHSENGEPGFYCLQHFFLPFFYFHAGLNVWRNFPQAFRWIVTELFQEDWQKSQFCNC